MARRTLTFCEVFVFLLFFKLMVFVLCMIISLFAGMPPFILETTPDDDR